MNTTATNFTLYLDSFRRLVARFSDGTEVVVQPVRAFPLSAPEEGFALLDENGHELAWIDSLSVLAPNEQALFKAELAGREFMPEITRIAEVSTYSPPSTWTMETDRGPCTLTLKALEDIRALTSNSLIVSDTFGINYRIRDLAALDKKSRRILDHFM